MTDDAETRKSLTVPARAMRDRLVLERRAAKPVDGLSVFVVRAEREREFGWEIRQFGGVTVEQGASFQTAAAATSAGMSALALLRAAPK